MQLLSSNRGAFCFQISRLEKRLLFAVLAKYPLVPVAHHRFSHTETGKDGQELLEESLADHRRAQRNQVTALLRAKSRFQANQAGWRFSLKPAQVEWLLQVLNDVRVGSWLALGAPDGPREMLQALNPQNFRHHQLMEAAGYFQMSLLTALDGKASQ
jgi:hypothetical protein